MALIVTASLAAIVGPAALAGERDAAAVCSLNVGEVRDRFDLSRDADLLRLEATAVAGLERARRQQVERATQRAALRAGRALEELSRAELDAYYRESTDLLTGKDRRALEHLQQLAGLARRETNPAVKRGYLADVAEVTEALNLNRRPPIPSRIDLVELPLVHHDYTHNPIATGETPAWNVEALPAEFATDLGRRQPPASSFWTPPINVASLDLFHGFGRSERLALEGEMLTYAEPKTSFGGHAGFVARWGEHEVKIKFGERHSEPFTARVFWALGFNVDPTDYVPRLQLKYDRRLLREFNQRREVNTRISALGVLPVYTLRFQPRHDPFAVIVEAVLRDGTRLSSTQLKTKLFHEADRLRPEDDPGNFRPEFEQTIDHLVLAAANVQVKSRVVRNLGPWSFGGLGHEGRRELRGAGLLAAWIGWSDSRFDNTRLRAVETPAGPQLRHYFTDLGGGLGRSTGLVYRQGELPNAFPWTFTRPPRVQGKGRMTIPFRIVGHEPIEDTPAFAEMTVDDARWMARWIAQLTERQLTEALAASGFDPAQVRLYTEKLVSRRDQLLRDLGLGEEIAAQRPAGADRALDYDPFNGQVKPGITDEASARYVVRRGEWVRRDTGMVGANAPRSAVRGGAAP